jgi:hypothetical protein
MDDWVLTAKAQRNAKFAKFFIVYEITRYEELSHLEAQSAPSPSSNNVAKQASPARRVVRMGCLVALLVACGGSSAFLVALQSGPVSVALPGGGVVKIGSEDMVLSNYSFQNGTTYFLDLKASGTRNILQLNYLEDKREIEFMLKHATKQEQGERHFLTLPVP